MSAAPARTGFLFYKNNKDALHNAYYYEFLFVKQLLYYIHYFDTKYNSKNLESLTTAKIQYNFKTLCLYISNQSSSIASVGLSLGFCNFNLSRKFSEDKNEFFDLQ